MCVCVCVCVCGSPVPPSNFEVPVKLYDILNQAYLGSACQKTISTRNVPALTCRCSTVIYNLLFSADSSVSRSQQLVVDISFFFFFFLFFCFFVFCFVFVVEWLGQGGWHFYNFETTSLPWENSTICVTRRITAIRRLAGMETGLLWWLFVWLAEILPHRAVAPAAKSVCMDIYRMLCGGRMRILFTSVFSAGHELQWVCFVNYFVDSRN